MWFCQKESPIADLKVLEGKVFADHRGEFARLYCESEFTKLAGLDPIMQINRSLTREVGAIRGVHFQYPPHSEAKAVRCLSGCVWDVAVDLRPESPSYLQWHAEELSGENNRLMLIPEGFGHGFQVMKEKSELLYLHTREYQADSEGGVRYDDPVLGIDWPLAVSDVSERDQGFSLIDESFTGIRL